MSNASVRQVLDSIRAPERRRSLRQRSRIAMASAAGLTLTIACLDALTPLGVSAAMLYTVVVLATLWIPSANPYLVVVITGAMTLAGLVNWNTAAPAWVVALNRAMDLLLQLGAAAVVSLHRRHQSERDTLLKQIEHALSEVRMLEGLLPICAWCKRIRNDKQQWEQLESYLSQHSHADFTHGACPDCAERLLAGRR